MLKACLGIWDFTAEWLTISLVSLVRAGLVQGASPDAVMCKFHKFCSLERVTDAWSRRYTIALSVLVFLLLSLLQLLALYQFSVPRRTLSTVVVVAVLAAAKTVVVAVAIPVAAAAAAVAAAAVAVVVVVAVAAVAVVPVVPADVANSKNDNFIAATITTLSLSLVVLAVVLVGCGLRFVGCCGC